MGPAVPGHLTIRSAEDQVYEALRDQIVHGLEPLTPLRLNEIAASLAVSTMPVRAALRRLESEGLVITPPGAARASPRCGLRTSKKSKPCAGGSKDSLRCGGHPKSTQQA